MLKAIWQRGRFQSSNQIAGPTQTTQLALCKVRPFLTMTEHQSLLEYLQLSTSPSTIMASYT